MKKVFLLIVAVALACVCVLSSCDGAEISKHPFEFTEDYIFTLEKEEGKEFRILQLADIQAPLVSSFNREKPLIDKLVAETNPDYIVLTGDNAGTGMNIAVTKAIVEYFDALDIPWSAVYGNHDFEGLKETANTTTSRRTLANCYLNGQNCLFAIGEESITADDQYIGNYIVNLKQGDDVVWSFFLIDSGSYEPNNYKDFNQEDLLPDVSGNYNYISTAQIDWYEQYVKRIAEYQYGAYDLAAGKVVPSFAFFHIPLYETRLAYAAAMEDPSILIAGEHREAVACAKYNSGMFDRVKSLGSTKGLFYGHDHINDSIMMYEGVCLAYGVKTGGQSYSNDNLHGGSLITIDKDAKNFTVERIIIPDSEV